ncbi:hypothetical protein LH454_09650 [Laribacter hongkongensis]|uniref:hypothetical protein n=1 Tax=Laribacter hongkongensis TaxID=168471 RepID=UPI001EFD5DE5|nr:hypothetical protein [Laribacter hongkongensis]MCG9001733.1 hypothetical protein [Laribacter hongkongensis]
MRVAEKISWRWVIFFLCFLMFAFSGLKNANEQADRQYRNLDKSDWRAANFWIKSAECAKETGVWLAICSENKFFPVAQFAFADDPGQAFLLGLVARLKNRSISVLDVVRLNVVVNFASLLAIAALLFAVRLEVASLVILMLSSVPYFSWVGASPHPGLIGVATMAAILPMAILFGEFGHVSRVKYILFLVVGTILLGLAAMLREPIGTMEFFISLGALVCVGLNQIGKTSSLRHKAWLLVLLVVVCLSWQMPRWVLMARDALFPIQPASLIQTHGISHNLYIGLGAGGENKFGINWDDSVGDAVVKSADPNVKYVSPEYFNILWREYLSRIAEDPLEVVRIYTVKLGKILTYRLPEWAPPLWLMIIGGCALLVAGYRHHSRWDVVGFSATSIVLVTSLAFIGMFITQGVLAHPDKQYAHPIGGFVLILFAVGFEILVLLRLQENRKP